MRLKSTAAAAALLTGALLAGAASAQSYDRLVVFGDSLSDNGNTFRFSGGRVPPSPPYFQGRFSNGPTFAELLGFTPLAGVGVVNGSTNYAFGGAETTGPGNAAVPSISQQVSLYQGALGAFGPRDLVSVLGGANNILNAFPAVGAQPNPVAAMSGIALGAASDIGQITGRIAGAGAGTILVGNLPDIGSTPAFRQPTTIAGAPLATLGTQTFNAALAANLNAVAGANAATNIILVDIAAIDAHVRGRPGEFGFTNVTDACFNGVQVCATPDSYYYWDAVHPTARTSSLFAAAVLDYAYYGVRGAPSAAIGETGLEHRQSAQAAALHRLQGEFEDGAPRFSLMVEGASSSEDARGAVPEIERDTVTLRVAIDGRVRLDTVAGLIFSGSESDVTAGPLAFQGSSYGFDGYVGLQRGSGFFNIVLGGANDEYSEYGRATGVGPIVHRSERINGSSLGGKLQAGVRFPMGGGELSPRAALGAYRTEVDAFNENGPAARHAQRAHEIEAVTGEASLRYDTSLGGLRAHAEAGYGTFLSYDGDIETALVNNPARPLGTDVEEPGRGFLLDLGLEGAVFGPVQLGAAYRGRFDDGSDSHAALLTLSLRR